MESGLQSTIDMCVTRNECNAHRESIERRIGNTETDIADIKNTLEKLDKNIQNGFNGIQEWILRGMFLSIVILISVLVGRSVDFGWLL